MRFVAKASSAGSTQRQATGLRRIFRGAIATRGAGLFFGGSGAPIGTSAFGHARITLRPSRVGLLFAPLAALLLSFAFGVSGASAVNYVQGPIFCSASGSAAGQCEELKGVAVDQSNGNVYVVDAGNLRINQFAPSGTFIRAFGWNVRADEPAEKPQVCTTATGCKKGVAAPTALPGQISATGSRGIAVDPETHIVYVSSAASRVNFFDGTTGAYLDTLTGTEGTADPEAPEKFAATTGLAVDTSNPDQHYLYVAINVNAQAKTLIDKFKVAGPGGTPKPAYICQITGTESNTSLNNTECGTPSLANKDGVFGRLWITGQTGGNLAVDASGSVYVAERVTGADNPALPLGEGNRNTISKFGSNGAFSVQFKPTQNRPEAVAASPTGNVFVAVGGAAAGNGGTRVHEYDPDDPAIPLSDFGDGVIGTGTGGSHGLAVRENGIVYAASKTNKRIYSFVPLPAGNKILTIEIEGPGTGDLTCDTGSGPSPCMATYPEGSMITVRATPDGASSAFTGWSGNGCSGTDTCVISNLGTDMTITATFEFLKRQLSISVIGTSVGTVTTEPLSAVDCVTGSTGTCDAEFDHGTLVKLIGTPGEDTRSAKWSGCNSIQAGRCLVVMNSDRTDITATFTSLVPELKYDCPNQSFRGGPAANLPDCRAYEMVSPLDKNGGDIQTSGVAPGSTVAEHAAFKQSAIDGEKITYSSTASFGDAVSSHYSNQYISSRGPNGWSTHGISPRRGATVFDPQFWIIWDIHNQFEAFTPDLSSAWVRDDNLIPLTDDALNGYVNLYRRDNISDSYEALTKVGQFSGPISADLYGQFTDSNVMGLRFQGFSSNLSHAIFTTNAVLTPDAIPGERSKLYDLHNGELSLVSVLPNGTPNPNNSYIGTLNTVNNNRAAQVEHAISDDGSRIFWTSRTGLAHSASGPGRIYVRINGETTVPVSESVSAADARFWTAAADGSAVLFTIGENLYEFNVDSETSNLIAGQVKGLAGASDDLSHIYFVSKEKLAPDAMTGQPNLYLSNDSGISLVAPLDEEDTTQSAAFSGMFSPIHVSPLKRSSRVTPDGHHLVFTSFRSLTGFDNTDAVTGTPDLEIFHYDADLDELTCVSCAPSGTRPVGAPILSPYTSIRNHAQTTLRAAATLPTWEHDQHASRVLTEDGNRVYFHTNEALTLRDTNDVQDVYQWEAEGSGTCEREGGCVDLISTGTSSEISEFYDASADGNDVFFSTTSNIDPRDEGLIDIYVAKVGGGLPMPPSVPECVGDACHSALPSPNDPTPASASFRGVGDPPPFKARRKKARRCKARVNRAARRSPKAKRKAAKRQVAKRCRRANPGGSR